MKACRVLLSIALRFRPPLTKFRRWSIQKKHVLRYSKIPRFETLKFDDELGNVGAIEFLSEPTQARSVAWSFSDVAPSRVVRHLDWIDVDDSYSITSLKAAKRFPIGKKPIGRRVRHSPPPHRTTIEVSARHKNLHMDVDSPTFLSSSLVIVMHWRRRYKIRVHFTCTHDNMTIRWWRDHILGACASFSSQCFGPRICSMVHRFPPSAYSNRKKPKFFFYLNFLYTARAALTVIVSWRVSVRVFVIVRIRRVIAVSIATRMTTFVVWEQNKKYLWLFAAFSHSNIKHITFTSQPVLLFPNPFIFVS